MISLLNAEKSEQKLWSVFSNCHYIEIDSKKKKKFGSASLLTAMLLFVLFTAWGRYKDCEDFMVMLDKISPTWRLGKEY